MPINTSQPSEQKRLGARLRWLYGEYRKALLNRKYYGYRLDLCVKVNAVVDYFVMFGTSGTVAGASFWKTPVGTLAWSFLGMSVAATTIWRKASRLTKRIETYGMLFSSYSDLYYDLDALVMEARAQEDFSEEMSTRLKQANKRFKALGCKDDPKPDERLRRKCFEEVKREIPADTLWMPPELDT